MDTPRARNLADATPQYVLLHGWQDAGIVLMDTETVNTDGEPRVLWVTDPPKDGNPTHVVKSYETFAEWCVFRLEEERDFHSPPDTVG
ncbi:MAG: hypothetical protein JWL77_6136 [Chthonomonadaceae bacterium]|nr:hypothetical protein [Chthonomonadaceae bacterium]